VHSARQRARHDALPKRVQRLLLRAVLPLLLPAAAAAASASAATVQRHIHIHIHTTHELLIQVAGCLITRHTVLLAPHPASDILVLGGVIRLPV